jgi:regulator of sirC expression with transglutaminase-like and TPR domain
MVGRGEEHISLAEAVLYIAGDEYPELDTRVYIRALDEMAREVRARPAGGDDAASGLRRLSRYLFFDQGFGGNTNDYYDPQNSYLNRVMDRKLGIPITLSIVYMEVARRLGMVLEGIGLPGHFILRHGPPEWELYVDPFNAGELLSRADCERLFQTTFQGRAEFREEFLTPCTKKTILVRVLSNLRNVYGQREDFRRALGATERIAIVQPDTPRTFRDKAALHLRLGELRRAAESLQEYLNTSPAAEDAERVKDQVRAIWQEIARRN